MTSWDTFLEALARDIFLLVIAETVPVDAPKQLRDILERIRPLLEAGQAMRDRNYTEAWDAAKEAALKGLGPTRAAKDGDATC